MLFLGVFFLLVEVVNNFNSIYLFNLFTIVVVSAYLCHD